MQGFGQHALLAVVCCRCFHLGAGVSRWQAGFPQELTSPRLLNLMSKGSVGEPKVHVRFEADLDKFVFKISSLKVPQLMFDECFPDPTRGSDFTTVGLPPAQMTEHHICRQCPKLERWHKKRVSWT